MTPTLMVVATVAAKGYAPAMSGQQPDELAPSLPRERWWKPDGNAPGEGCSAAPREGLPCPACLLGELHFNGLFQLICDTCGRVAEAAVFT